MPAGPGVAPLRACRFFARALAERRVTATDVIPVVAVLTAIWLAAALFLQTQREEEVAALLADARRLALAFRESVARRVDVVDNTLRLLRSAETAGASPVERGLLTRAGADGPVFQLSFIGADGRLVSSNLEPVASRMDLSDREHFRVHADNPGRDELFVSVPLIGRASGKPSIQFTRRVTGADGRFAGVVVASLAPAMLTELHHAMGEARGVLTLIGTDGRLRARSPEAAEGIPPRLERRLAAAAARSAGGDLLPRAADGIAVLGAHRRIPGRPLAVAVTFDLREALHAYEARRRIGLAATLAVSLLVVVGGCMLGERRARLTRSRQDLAASQAALEAAIEGVSQGIVMFDAADRVVVANRRAAEIIGVPEATLAARPRLIDLILTQFRAGDFGARFPDADSFLAFARRQWTDTTRDHVYERQRADGTVLEVRTHPMAEGGAIRTYTDVTERRAAEERARHFALHDSLTGLPNRMLLASRLEAAIGGAGCAVLFLDLDRFKLVNDLHGHQAGDRLLAAVATRLRPELRQGDTLARLGGDEFAILLAQADRAMAVGVARRLVELICLPFELDGLTHLIGVSIGVALCPDHGVTGPDLLKAADTAMYRAKRNGKATYAVYDNSMGNAAAEQRNLERDIGEALTLGQFRLVYQPVCNAASGLVEGFEALIRWDHPVRGLVPPTHFIPTAERTGLIVPIGAWALETACAEAASWDRPARIAVNVSPPQFMQPDLCDQLRGVLHRTGLPADRLDIEVTEGLMLGEAEVVLQNMQGLRAMGVKISLDDFGTGHSSLSYLCRFPFDTLKIDRSFVQNLGDGRESRAIVSSVINLGRSLRLNVVAEGVETDLQLQELREMRCNRVQGYLFGKPMPPDEARALVALPAAPALPADAGLDALAG